MRKGMSFTLTLLIVALVLLAVGITIITLGQNSIGSVGDLFRSNTENSETDIARQNCEQERQRVCRERALEYWLHGGLSWTEQASYQGRTCREWAEEEQIYGIGGTERLPECEQEPSRTEKIDACEQAIEQICEDDSEQWGAQNASLADTEGTGDYTSDAIPQACSQVMGALFGGDVSPQTCGEIN